MAETLLVVVDVQNDFVTGSLGSAMAQAMLPTLVEKVRGHDGPVVFTRDTHYTDYLSTQEGRLLPVTHCVEGTWGWQIVPELEELRKEAGWSVYDKEIFGSVRLAQDIAAMAERGEIDAVEFTGLCTDICVVSNALLARSFAPQLAVYADPACCAGTSQENHEAALQTMRSCQVQMR
ncbi:MAG: isochorismatase family cysteine hydrolase [Desulfovibrionaceae bacterium]|nr:isochorismatase family cysteine hydrolase [Desulfovibrionaceae bacterium]